MSNPNPLIPQGTFQAQAAKGASNVRIAVATIVAIHVVFFGGLLLQGCKRDGQVAQNAETNPPATAESPSTNLALPPLDSSSLYYSSSSNLPPESGNALYNSSSAGSNSFAQQSTRPDNSTPDSMWQGTNHSSPLTETPDTGMGATGNLKEYTIARGDLFSKIARKHGVTMSALRAANPGVDPNRIRAGDKLNIPEPAPQTSAQGEGLNAPRSEGGTSGNVYTVKSGDSLTKIAKAHGITVGQLSAANNLKTARINVGQKLKIPAPAAAESSNGTSNSSRQPRSSAR